MVKQRIKDFLNSYIFDSPFCKTLISFILPLITGLFSSMLIMEITTPAGLYWRGILKTKSLYVLLGLILIDYIYNRTAFLREKEIMRFSDNDYCIAYMRGQCLPEAAKRFKELIRDGDGGEFRQAMDELKKVLKK